MEGTILIIDDDQKLQELLSEYLSGFGYVVKHNFTGKHFLQDISTYKPDIIILDIMLPERDGFDILRNIRENQTIPVIMLTARGEETDRIVGLELGADDYLPKPFNPRELMARIKAIMRRSQSEQKKMTQKDTLRCGNFILELATYCLKYNDNETELSSTEFKVLETLMKSPNVVLSRDDIMNMARGRDFMAFDRSIDVHISKLRAKVEALTGSRNFIKTVWGSGYMFVVKNETK